MLEVPEEIGNSVILIEVLGDKMVELVLLRRVLCNLHTLTKRGRS